MTDNSIVTGAGTNAAAEWIQADFSSSLISGCVLGGGVIPAWGAVAPFLNGSNIEAWVGSAWVNVGIVSGVTDSGTNSIQTFNWTPVQATKLRIARTGYLSTTEFQIIQYTPPIFGVEITTDLFTLTMNIKQIFKP
jgi:hypothetical protein